jgi:hypothetical protein
MEMKAVGGGFDPAALAQKVDGKIDDEVRKHNASPMQYRAAMNAGAGSMFCEISNPTGQSYDDQKDKGPAASSMFTMIGKAPKKGSVTAKQLLGKYDGMGLPKSYKQMKEDHSRFIRAANGKIGKKDRNDSFSQGQMQELVDQLALERERMRIHPQGVKANPEMAAKMGLGDEVACLVQMRHETQSPDADRLMNGMKAGFETDTNQALATVSAQKITETVQQTTDMSRERAELLVGKEAVAAGDKDSSRAILKSQAPDAPKAPTV